MQLIVKHGDVLSEPADVLICSANFYLNLSGGVGGEILRRHGDTMQQALQRYLVDHQLKFVQPGDVVETEETGTAFKYVLHAVAVDVWYRSSADVVARALHNAFEIASARGTKTVAVVAIGTGYGHLSMKEFAQGLRRSLDANFTGMESVTIVVPSAEAVAEIRSVLATNAF